MTTRGYILRLALAFVITLLVMGAVKSLPTNDVRGALTWWELKDTRFDAMVGDAPRVIFAGGSATLFGLSAEEFTAQTGQPAFNFGLHANFGQEVLVDAALAKARPGDLLVWSPELSGLTGSFPTIAIYGRPLEPSPQSAWRLVEHWFRTPPDLIARWPRPIPRASVYHADAIGPLGDQLRNVGQVSDALCLQGEESDIVWELIDRVVSRAEAEDVTLVVRMPVIADLPCNDWADPILAALAEGLTARDLLALNLEAMRRPTHEFHDTHYHLNQEGVARATRALVEQLKQAGRLPLSPR
ncbi:MAG: hypothetical protein ACPGU1_16040 [Myxococcota bacterium]